jgi:transitional endoplasmic reticulum ATPase
MPNDAPSNVPDCDFKVGEAQSRDVGRGIARFDPQDMDELGVATGDIVEIRGKRKTVAKVMPAFKEFRGQRSVQIDGIVRDNAGVSVGDKVAIQPVQPQPATALELVPVTPIPRRPGYNAYIGKLIDGLTVIEGDRIRATLFGSRFQEFRVHRTEPKGPVIIDPTTAFSIVNPKFQASETVEKQSKIAYEDIGGLRREVERVREMIELPLKHPAIFERLGIDPPRGLLLAGPPGVGKTLIARVIAQETNAHFTCISGPEIIHKFYGESEAKLRQIFEDASRNQPAIIFIDEIDSIAPKRGAVLGEVEKRVVGQLLTLMDGLRDRGQVVVIGATNIPNALDPALRRPGRFDREIRLGVPNASDRREILEIHSRGMPLSDDVNLGALSEATHGFVGADLESLCREAAMIALRRAMLSAGEVNPRFVEEKINELSVAMDDFRQALTLIEPSALREFAVEVPQTRWHEVGGLEGVRDELMRAVILPLKRPSAFARMNVRPVRGILLHGPPGTGKTLLARALACESGINFISVRGPELLSKYVGESERALRDLFSQAKQAAPCIIFFDEIDSLMPGRQSGESPGAAATDRVLGQFLTEIDGVEELKGVVVMAATNRLDRIDAALLRSGRFDLVQEIPPPDATSLERIFEIHLRNRPVAADVDVAALAEASAGFNGADIEATCRIGATRAIEAWSARFQDDSSAVEELSLSQSVLLETIERVRKMHYEI